MIYVSYSLTMPNVTATLHQLGQLGHLHPFAIYGLVAVGAPPAFFMASVLSVCRLNVAATEHKFIVHISSNFHKKFEVDYGTLLTFW